MDASTDETALILRIAKRAHEHMPYRSVISLAMDITAVNCNGTRLKLAALAQADACNLVHDVGGIAANLDRETGQLLNGFRPRFA
jgi:hypothetical protein